MSKFSKGDKVFLAKIKNFVRDFDYQPNAFSFAGFDSDGNAVINSELWGDEIFSNIYQVKFFLGLGAK
jgi:hypothetical protein